MSNAEVAAVCQDLTAAGFDQQKAAEEVWEALLSAGAFSERPYDDPFVFASGQLATIKVNAEVLNGCPKQQEIILGHMATFPCIQEADVLLYVPEGMRIFTNILGQGLGKQVAQAERIPGAGRYDFRFVGPADKELALAAKYPRIIEDIVTTLGSVNGMANLLRRGEQPIHSLAFLLRGEVDPVYQTGLTDHYLVRRQIPLDKAEFRAQLTVEERASYHPSQSE